MIKKLRLTYRLLRLKRLLASMTEVRIVMTSLKINPSTPIQLSFRGQLQLGLFIADTPIRVYVHEYTATPFVVAHLTVLLRKLGSVEVRGLYSAVELPVDTTPKGRQQLTLVKDGLNKVKAGPNRERKD